MTNPVRRLSISTIVGAAAVLAVPTVALATSDPSDEEHAAAAEAVAEAGSPRTGVHH